MKTLLFISTILLFAFTETKSNENDSTYYYFYTSRPWDMSNVVGKADYTYTEILEFKGEATAFKSLALKWMEYVNSKCKYGKCTSDLNYYNSFEEAKVEFSKIEKSAKFNPVKVDYR